MNKSSSFTRQSPFTWAFEDHWIIQEWMCVNLTKQIGLKPHSTPAFYVGNPIHHLFSWFEPTHSTFLQISCCLVRYNGSSPAFHMVKVAPVESAIGFSQYNKKCFGCMNQNRQINDLSNIFFKKSSAVRRKTKKHWDKGKLWYLGLTNHHHSINVNWQTPTRNAKKWWPMKFGVTSEASRRLCCSICYCGGNNYFSFFPKKERYRSLYYYYKLF